jgi:hypothetical protein
MRHNDHRPHFTFPRWTNEIRPLVTILVLGGLVYLIVLIVYGASPETTNVGYAPEQPIPYSHALHVGELGVDCRYCHVTVETAPAASLPASEICMNCHASIKTKSESLAPLRASIEAGSPIEWIRVHDLPDFVYFDHSAHVSRGVACVSCHGRVDQMEVVRQENTLSMGWCLDCHRNPDGNLRPKDEVTSMTWASKDPLATGREIRLAKQINPATDCSTCHR